MELRFYPVQWTTGDVFQYDLPLDGVSLSATEGGSGTATGSLDLWRMIDQTSSQAAQFAQSYEINKVLKPGFASIIAVREDSTNGSDNPLLDTVMGEWLISSVDVQHSSPVVRLQAVELEQWLAANVMKTSHRKRKVDPLALAREIMAEALDGMAYSLVGSKASAATVSVDFRKGVTTYAEALSELVGDRLWGWHVAWSIDAASTTAEGRTLKREVVFSSQLTTTPVDAPIEISTPGGDVMSGMDLQQTASMASLASELWAWGAGAGSSQIGTVVQRALGAGMPRLSRTLSVPDAMTRERLQQLTEKAAAAMTQERQSFTVVARLDRITTPPIGRVQAVLLEPSISMPVAQQFNARATAWQWRQPKAGELETITMTMERV